MSMRFKRLASFVFLISLFLPFQNCSQYNDPSPFEMDGSALAAASSSPTEVRLDSPVGVLDLGQYDLTISVGGECNVGLSSKHYIEVKLMDSVNQPIPVREDALCPKEGLNLPADCFRATQFHCEHGRYEILLPLNCSAYRGQTQSLYRLTGQMVTFDSNSQEVRNTKAAFDRFFNIAWGLGSCP
jgi:hypothetical protein